MSNLVIVESPAKAKTIKKYLGSKFQVIASMGHVRDLPKSTLGVDLENRYEPRYINMRDKSAVIKELKQHAKKADKIYLATDPDREGEAISWHLAHLLKLDLDAENRITFNEITKAGVKNGMKLARKIDIDLVNAQQARRILDRIVGYKLSPYLWKKIKRGLSAGRVQSVVVKLIVDREREIKAFIEEEFWTIEANLSKDLKGKPFEALLHSHNGKKIKIEDKEQATQILAELNKEDFLVKSMKKGQRKKSPYAPFSTSTMQQEASKRLGFQAKRTMRAAQELYEGINVKGYGAIGLITYMRTDSLRISEDARKEAYSYIQTKYGENYIPPKPNFFKSKSNSQDAHEAIRPTTPSITPDMIKESVSPDQFKLYKLIWERFIASQMSQAIYDTVSLEIAAGEYTFKASGSSVRFDGFTVLYQEKNDLSKTGENASLPEINEGEKLNVKKVEPKQHFTQPPPRFTEASLIKMLEENGIGRPSTYAPTISTVMSRNYVEREAKAIKPTLLGEIIADLMQEKFKTIVDVDFTAHMEQELDLVEVGEKDWISTLDEFYKDFEVSLKDAEENMGEKIKLPEEETDIICELCGKNMIVKTGRFGKFLACPGFPDCKNTKKIVQEAKGSCPKCGEKLEIRKTKKGKLYYGCAKNPTCDFMVWDEPLAEDCTVCGKTLLKKKGKSGKIYCSNSECDYERGLKD